MKAHLVRSLLFSVSIMPGSLLLAADDQPVSLPQDIQIPGGSLKAGLYTFGIEDRLADRTVVRISTTRGIKGHYLLLTVPNPKLQADSGLQYFNFPGESKRALRAWKCSKCSAPLEFVYPKIEALKITDASGQEVLAVDPAHDKLPNNLSADDMRVVTLWSLTPERVKPDNAGDHLKPANYLKSHAPAAGARTAPHKPATLAESQAAALQVASTGRQRLPETASNTPLILLSGFICLMGAFMLRLVRLRHA